MSIDTQEKIITDTFEDSVARLKNKDRANRKKQVDRFWQKWEEDYNERYMLGIENNPDLIDCF